MSLWCPSASIESLRHRANCLNQIRSFFIERDYLEVQTPIMAQYGVTDRYLNNIQAIFRGKQYALQTSPEYHMKRLLAAGSGPIFQIFQAFRDDELGRWHNPEFTMLEWYQLNIDHFTLLQEVGTLIQQILNCPPLIQISYRDAFMDICGIDPFTSDVGMFQTLLKRYELDNVLDATEDDRDQYLFLLMSHVVEPHFATAPSPVAVFDFPPSQASLAKISHNGLAARFEVYYHGVELANGFYELTDVALQQARFEEDIAIRKKHLLPEVKADEYLLAALAHGLPPCSGVALGVDRLIAFALKKTSLSEVLAFDFCRA